MSNYYVAAGGSDSNSGTSTGSPWQTIGKIAGTTFSPGDIIAFNKGDTWVGTIGGTLSLAGASTSGTAATCTMTIASPCVVTKSAHGLVAGNPVYFTTTGTLPTGITSKQVYYVISTGLTTNTFEFSATVGGSAVNTSGSQSGTQTLVIPILFTSYGSGADPLSSGFNSSSAWTQISTNIWESTSTISTLSTANLATMNLTNIAQGRYPATTMLNIDSFSGSTITSTGLSGIVINGVSVTNWSGGGAQLVVYTDLFNIEIVSVSSQSGNTITYSGSAILNGSSNPQGFFIQNDVRTLGVSGQWYYNPSTNKIRIFTTVNPNGSTTRSMTGIQSIKGITSITF